MLISQKTSRSEGEKNIRNRKCITSVIIIIVKTKEILPRFTTTVCNGGSGAGGFRNRRKRRIIRYDY